MSAGERAIAKEMRREEKERKKRIREANKMLIPVSKKTEESLNLVSFDPSGAFFFYDERWMKCYKVEGDLCKLVDAAKSLEGRIRITLHMGDGSDRVTCHLSLMETGEIYEEVRVKISADEAELRKAVSITPLSVDEVMNEIIANNLKDIRFSYPSYVRGNKDWKKECISECLVEDVGFKMQGMYGAAFQILSYPAHPVEAVIEQLKSLGISMYISLDLNALTDEEAADFKRAIEKKYNRRLPVAVEEHYQNFSTSIVIFGDSRDAVNIATETICSMLMNQGFLVAPAFHNQNVVTESALSYGLLDCKAMRNVDTEVIKAMLGGVDDADAKIEIRAD